MGTLKAISKHGKSENALLNCVTYVLRENKTSEDACYVTGLYDYPDITPQHVTEAFMKEKNAWGKASGRFYDHYVYSWAHGEQIVEKQALAFATELAEKMFLEHQALIAVHHDKDHLHAHMIFNSVSYVDGRKLETSANDLQHFKSIADQMCREKGYHVVEKGKHFNGTKMREGEITAWNNDKYRVLEDQTKKSYVAACGAAVLRSLERKPKTKEEFVYRMKQQGWSVRWSDERKYITFIDKEGKRVRDSNLAKTFHMDVSKEALERQFTCNQEAEEHEPERTERISVATIAEAGTTASYLAGEVSHAAAQYIQNQKDEDQRKKRRR